LDILPLKIVKIKVVFGISGSHGGEYENGSLLGYITV
jgi:hypothetical protein